MYFKKEQKIKAYYAFSLMIQLADSLKFQTSNLIGTLGWELAWVVIGAFGVVVGILVIFTTPNVDVKKETKPGEIVEKKQKLTLRVLLKRYKIHFKMMFTTFAANMILIASFFRLMQTTIVSLYYQDYFRIWPS
jgi:hypothetical protein